jgi:PAS domain S-box-containing protein
MILEVQTSARDVTERMQAEETLREAEERYRTLVERVPAIVYRAEFGEAGTWRFVSPQIESILGYSPEEWSGDPTLFDRRIHPDDEAKYRVDEERALETGSLSAEFRMFRKDDQVAWIRDEARIYFGPSGEPVAMQGLMFDVTELEELIRTRARLVQLLSHELFTPITSIQGAALTLLEMGEGLAPEDLQVLAGGVERVDAAARPTDRDLGQGRGRHRAHHVPCRHQRAQAGRRAAHVEVERHVAGIGLHVGDLCLLRLLGLAGGRGVGGGLLLGPGGPGGHGLLRGEVGVEGVEGVDDLALLGLEGVELGGPLGLLPPHLGPLGARVLRRPGAGRDGRDEEREHPDCRCDPPARSPPARRLRRSRKVLVSTAMRRNRGKK